MDAIFDGIVIYASDMKRTARFYREFFGFSTSGEIVDGLIELSSPKSGGNIRILQAAGDLPFGQAVVKVSFAVSNVEVFKAESEARGLRFGSTFVVNGYSFANAEDPDKNPISISSCAYRHPVKPKAD
jgi:predicted enzyme related to lactoylglutathione lyase